MKRNTLTTAVLAGLTGIAGMASVANAVNVNPDGLGQVLLFPYYTARGGNDTLISIVNTTDQGKAVKIRFIEALNSREVLDFNIYMSAFDVWAAAITETAEGGAKITFSDTTCTAPYLLATMGGEQEFLTGALTDGGPTGADRTASGYVEVIEMGVLTGDAAVAAEHVQGVPPTSGAGDTVCGLFTERWISANFANGTGEWGPSGNPGFEGANYEIDPPIGGLFGAGSIINIQNGTQLTYNAVAIDGFFDDSTGQHTDPASLAPSLASGNVTESNVFVNGFVDTQNWPAGIFAVNAALNYEMLMNEYVVDPEFGARSEWVVTFPTKRFHVDEPGEELPDVIPPFTSLWTEDEPYSCDVIDLAVWDREEQTPDPLTGGVVVSPQVPGERPQFTLCREANVIRFASDDSEPAFAEITGEPSVDEADLEEYGYRNFGVPFTEGWARFDFTSFNGQSPVGSTNVLRGLPAIGLWLNAYTNDNVVGGVLSNYGGSFQHRGSRGIPVSVAD